MRATLVLSSRDTGEVAFEGFRVSRSLRCPVCAHLHREQSWCLVDPQRGLAICPRVESDRRIGDAGYLHRLDGSRLDDRPLITRPSRPDAPAVDLGHLQRGFRAAVTPRILERLAERWGCSVGAVDRLGCGWDGSAWTFPMRDHQGRIIGYRRRLEDGGKLCLKGSRLGLIVPTPRNEVGSLFVVEGESDLACAIDLKVDAIARPGCRVCEHQVAALARGRDTVIVADKDAPGMEGARALRSALLKNTRSVCIVQPPGRHKDLRDWVRAGGSRDALRFIVTSMRGF